MNRRRDRRPQTKPSQPLMVVVTSPDAVKAYTELRRPGDRAVVLLERSGLLPYIDGQRGIIIWSAADFTGAAQLLSTGDFVCYNPELNKVPREELEQLAATVFYLHSSAEARGLGLMVSGGSRIAERVAEESARWADWYNVQAHNEQAEGGAYRAMVEQVARTARLANPDVKVSSQVTTGQGASANEIAAAMKIVVDLVDGYTLWVTPEGLPVYRDLMEWLS